MLNDITGNKSSEKNPLNPSQMQSSRTEFTSYTWFLFSRLFQIFMI